jgi:hypothetical protein
MEFLLIVDVYHQNYEATQAKEDLHSACPIFYKEESNG